MREAKSRESSESSRHRACFAPLNNAYSHLPVLVHLVLSSVCPHATSRLTPPACDEMPRALEAFIVHFNLVRCASMYTYAWGNVADNDGDTTARKALVPGTKSTSIPHLRQSSTVQSNDASHIPEGNGAIDADDLMLKTLLCEDRGCSDACQSYVTPINKCYNGQELFPDDPSWGEYDVLDMYACLEGVYGGDGGCTTSADLNGPSSFKRTFFASQGSSCSEQTDEFDEVPLDECIGPFGDPRPWGRFEIAAKE